jgi:hypothetical protein
MLGQFTYSISKRTLTGTLEGSTYTLYAVSGFAGGWQEKSDEPHVPRAVRENAISYVDRPNWGPIPPGFYRIRRPELKGGFPVARLESHLGPKPFGRDNFEIHGRAPHKFHGQFAKHGSHGCIVPKYPQQFWALMHALATTAPGHEFVATLQVVH